MGRQGRPIDQQAWSAFAKLVDRCQTEFNLIVVRPPVAPELYRFENEVYSDIIEPVQAHLAERSVAYVDLNPHPFFSTDLTHIDWYHTEQASRMLARRLLSVVDVALARWSASPAPAL